MWWRAAGLASGVQAGPTQPDGGGDEVGVVVAPDPAAGNVSAEMLAAMQRDLKVTAAQARARLVSADWAARLDKPLRQRLGRAFGGSWLAEDGQEFVVALTDRRLEGLVRASGATPKLVARSEAELTALGATLAARAKDAKNVPAALAGWVIDPQTNRVRMEHLPGGLTRAQAFAAAAGLTADQVDYLVVPARATKQYDVKGGDKYFPTPGGFPVGLDPSYCTTGFAVRSGPQRTDCGSAWVARCKARCPRCR